MTEAQHHEEHHDELPFWRHYIFSTDHKIIGIQYGLTALVFLFFGFCLMMLMRWQLAYPGKALPIEFLTKWLGESRMPGGVMAPEFYNQLGANARHDYGLLGCGATGSGRVWQLPRTPAGRRTGHGVPEAQYVELLGLLYRWRGHAWQLLCIGRLGPVRLDFLPAAFRHHTAEPFAFHRPIALAHRHGLPDHVFVAGFGQHDYHHRPVAGQGTDLDAPAVLRVGAAGHGVPAVAGVPALGSRRGDAVDGSRGKHQLFSCRAG